MEGVAGATGGQVKKASFFAARLRSLMAEAGVSAPELAARAGLSRQSLHKILAGSVPSWPTVQKIAEGLGVPTDAFKS